MKIRCIAIDDEPLALDLLEDFTGRVPFLELIRKFDNAIDAMKLLEEQAVELIFLDIQMPDLTGVQMLKALQNKPKVIFTTAYPDYALEGFDLDAVDYLLKPFTFDRFLRAANKARQFVHSGTESQAVEEADQKDYIFIKSGYDTVKVRFDEILYIEGDKDYLRIHITDNRVMTLMSMKAMLGLLPEKKFARIHRSYIIPMEKIELIQRQQVKIAGKEIPIGDTYRKAFFDRIDQG